MWMDNACCICDIATGLLPRQTCVFFFVQLRVVKAFKSTMEDLDDQRSMVSGQSCLSLRSLRSHSYRPFYEFRCNNPYENFSRNSFTSLREARTFGDSKFLLSDIPEVVDAQASCGYKITNMNMILKPPKDGIGKSASFDLRSGYVRHVYSPSLSAHGTTTAL
ncbi:hypothetical protein D917_02516 [Trichinella nativa]|uniref:Uncharacterized protein n=1 Tax=Trichinella nativa TaxID=6335 RepID=A0A1Y3EIQ7_9BILA|nr:hypothetical protein D917_02516 [Trichinella nativa]